MSTCTCAGRRSLCPACSKANFDEYHARKNGSAPQGLSLREWQHRLRVVRWHLSKHKLRRKLLRRANNKATERMKAKERELVAAMPKLHLEESVLEVPGDRVSDAVLVLIELEVDRESFVQARACA